MTGPRLKIPLVLAVALVLHTSVLPLVRVHGVCPDLMLLVSICAGLVGGPSRGALVGFGAGLAADLFLQTPIGLSALTFTVVAFTVGTVQSSIVHAAFWIPPLTAVIASAFGVLLYALTGAVVGEPQLLRPTIGFVIVGVALLNAPLSIPAVRAVAWALAGGEPA